MTIVVTLQGGPLIRESFLHVIFFLRAFFLVPLFRVRSTVSGLPPASAKLIEVGGGLARRAEQQALRSC